MTKLRFILCLICLSSINLAQGVHNDWALNYRAFSYDVDKRINSINKSFGTNFSKSNMEYVGASITYPADFPRSKNEQVLVASFYFHYGLNKSYKINDTLRFAMGGWNLGMGLGTHLIRTKNGVFFVSPCAGGFIGQDKSRFSKQTHQWFSSDHDLYMKKNILTLSGSLEIRFHLFKLLSLYYKPTYYFEPFNFKTKTKGDMVLPIENQRYTGLSHTFGIGFLVH